MKLSAAEKLIFDQVMIHHTFDVSEIELCKQAYRRDPEAGRMTYQALYNEATHNWRTEMSQGITERMKQHLTATGPGQPDKPMRPPQPGGPTQPGGPANPRQPASPDGPKEAA